MNTINEKFIKEIHTFSIELPVPIQERVGEIICVLGVSILPLSTISLLGLGIVPTLWYFCYHFNILSVSEINFSL